MSYSDAWALAEHLSLEQAACLWCDAEPMTIIQLGKPIATVSPAIVAIFSVLQNAAIAGSLKVSTVGATHIVGDHSGSIVARAALAEFAKSKRQFPTFLFDTVAPTINNDTQVAKSKGGRNPTHDWNACIGEIVRLANTPDGLPERPELIEHLKEWFSSRFTSEPSPSQLYEKVRPIYEYLEAYKTK